MATQKIRMLKDGKDAEGNKLTEGRVYELEGKLSSSLVSDGFAERLDAKRVEGSRGSTVGHDPREIQQARDPKEQGKSIIADPDMSQNEQPFDRPKDHPDPDLSKERTRQVVGAKLPGEGAKPRKAPLDVPAGESNVEKPKGEDDDKGKKSKAKKKSK